MSGTGKIFDLITTQIAQRNGCYWVLLDPDDFTVDRGAEVAGEAQQHGVDAFLIGGSLLYSNHFNDFVKAVRLAATVPVILFPGDATQVCAHADALLYLSLISGRNPVNLIGEHVKAAPMIKKIGIEPIATAYMLVESGIVSSVEFMSNTRPLPRNKPMIAAAHALAAQYMGMSMVYLEAGSGAKLSVPEEMIKMVKSYMQLPLIVGGGITTTDDALSKLDAGADIIVTGNLLKRDGGVTVMNEIAAAVRRR
ncbi:MAG: geranylgeranylglyceryl/heptaprenylglyceryl phosphate synthase [Chitinivibrionales bacterium]|nr:geranylgeranylglyceryl/heptaprenylglyceryl phosphate synthase [Chitinivibrionales bacterium]